jgi:hypothetical protein
MGGGEWQVQERVADVKADAKRGAISRPSKF